jgi:hypothetical protein
MRGSSGGLGFPDYSRASTYKQSAGRKDAKKKKIIITREIDARPKYRLQETGEIRGKNAEK